MSNARISRGAEWRKWDLHVHTPASLHHQYRVGATGDPWDRFLSELAALPEDFAVVGINDYWFLDGYQRVKQEFEAGRLPNLQAIFPVIEMRLAVFAGSGDALSRVNYHVVFDPELDVEVIQQQFLGRMSGEFELTAGSTGTWSGTITKDSLQDLGASVQASTPDGRRSHESDLKVGFNNLVVPLEKLQDVLGGSYLDKRHITALGKTEWADIRWDSGSPASKRSLINGVDLIFTAFEDVSNWRDQKRKLAEANVNDRLLDCSDAHTWSDTTTNKDRIGNCATWIRASASFAGLRHAIAEFDERVFVGLEPADRARRRSAPEKIIDSVRVRPRQGNSGTWFDYELPLNQGIVAVIGNRGQGKSALVDCIARGGNSSREADFGFLTKERFLAARNKQAQSFEVTLRWLSGDQRTVGLDERYDLKEVEAVEYLPQKLIERICSSDPQSGHRETFEGELRRVLFHHIAPVDRQGATNLDELMDLRMAGLDREIVDVRERQSIDCSHLVALHDEAVANNLDDLNSRQQQLLSGRARAQSELDGARLELEQHEQDHQVDSALLADRERLRSLTERLQQLTSMNEQDVSAAARASRWLTEMESLRSDLAVLRSRVGDLDTQFRTLVGRDESVISLVVDEQAIERRVEDVEAERNSFDKHIENRAEEVEAVSEQREAAESRLGAVDVARDALRRKVEQLELRIRELDGSPEDAQSISGLGALIARAEALPAEIEETRSNVLSATRRLHALLARRLEVMQELYRPASDFVRMNELAAEAGLQFVADLVFGPSWSRVSSGLDERRNAELKDFLDTRASEVDAADADEVVALAEELIVRLEHERGSRDGASRNLRSAFKTKGDVAEWFRRLVGLEWIETRFSLNGNGLTLDQLSPGQRGLILLLFYMVVDQSTVPLLVDQPEENLDNEAVRRVLIDALKQARHRRQVIIVTHNANLAVVGDADQIVQCRQDGDRFTVSAGTLAEHDTGEGSIKVLEGDRPAFNNRRRKWDEVVPGQ